MAEEDTNPIAALKAGGFRDDEITTWANTKREEMERAGTPASEIARYFGADQPADDPHVSKPFIKRLQQGADLQSKFAAFIPGFAEGFGSEPLGFSPDTIGKLRDMGIYRDENGRGGPLSLFNETVGTTVSVLGDTLFRAVSGTVHGLSGMIGQTVKDITDSESQGAQAGKAARELLEFQLLQTPNHVAERAVKTPGGNHVPERIGGLPREADFENATQVLTNKSSRPAETPVELTERLNQHDIVRGKLDMLYYDKGIHPAEVLADAERDPVLAQQLLSESTHIDAYGLSASTPFAAYLDQWLQFIGRQAENEREHAFLTRLEAKHKETIKQATERGTRNWDVEDDLGDVQRRKAVVEDELAKGRASVVKIDEHGELQFDTSPDEIATHMQEFGRRAGFRFMVGPEMTSDVAAAHGREAGPQFQGAVSRSGRKIGGFVYMPSNPEAAMRSWYGLGRSEVLYHEAAHAIDFHVFNAGKDTTGKLDAALAAELEAVSRRFRPKLWELFDNKPEYKGYGNKPYELMADAIATWLSNPGARKDMPLFAARYGDALEPYVDIAQRSLPKRTAGGWEPPPPPGGEPPGGGRGPDFSGRDDAGRGGFGPPALPPTGIGPAREPPPPPRAPDLDAARAAIDSRLSVGESAPRSGFSFAKMYTWFVDKFFPIKELPNRAGSPGVTLPAERKAELNRLIAMSEPQLASMERAAADVHHPPETRAHYQTQAQGLREGLERWRTELATERPARAALTAADDPYKLARLYSGWAGKADTMLRRETFDFHTYERSGRSLEEILAPLHEMPGGVADFRRFVAAARAAELDARGVEHGFDMVHVRAFGQAMTRRFGPVMEELVDYQNRVAAYLRDSGVLNERAYDAMVANNRLFVPFHRVIGENPDQIALNRVGATSLQARNPIVPIHGSDLMVIDPLETIVKNTYLLTQMAEKNAVGVKLIDLLLENDAAAARAGRAERTVANLPATVDQATHNAVSTSLRNLGARDAPELANLLHDAAVGEREGHVTIYRDGVRETYEVAPELARAFKGLDVEAVGMWERILSKPANLLRAGVVLSPEFGVRFIWREFFNAVATVTHGVFSPADTVRGIAGYIMKDADFVAWMKGGGSNNSFVAFERQFMRENLHELTQETGLFTRSWNVIIDPNASWLHKGGAVLGLPFAPVGRYVLHPLQMFMELTTNATRLGAFKKEMRRLETRGDGYVPERTTLPAELQGQDLRARQGEFRMDDLLDAMGRGMREGGDSAEKQRIIASAWESREAGVDNARIGAKMYSANMIVAFLNAPIQETAKMLEQMRSNPFRTTTAATLSVTLPSLLLWWANKDDSRYKELPTWEKDVFWIVPTDKWEAATPDQAGVRANDQVRVFNGQMQVNNGTLFRIPKPFFLGMLFGSFPERMAEKYLAENPRAFQDFGGSVMDALVGGNMTPSFVSPMIEQFAGRRIFASRPLVPHQMEGQLPEYQFTPYTTETTKALGEFIAGFPGIKDARVDQQDLFAGGVARALTNPIMIENYVRAWGGTMGQHALNIVDYGLRKAGVVPDPANAPASTLADLPVVKAFIARYPMANTQSIEDFYRDFEIGQRHFATWQRMAKEGNEDAMNRIEAAGGEYVVGQLTGMKNALATQSQVVRAIQKDPTTPAAEKRQLIDTLYFGMIQIAREGNEAIRQVKEAAK